MRGAALHGEVGQGLVAGLGLAWLGGVGHGEVRRGWAGQGEVRRGQAR